MSNPETAQCFVIGLQPRVDSAFLSTEVASKRCGLNTGNLVASFALCSHLDFPEVVDIGAPLRQMNRAGRVGVVQGANQLGAHFQGGAAFQPINEVEIGLALVGVGVQGSLTGRHRSEAEPKADDNIPSGAFDWIARIVERAPSDAPNIGVRGSVTQKVLAEHGFADRAEVVGCPSLFINPNPHLGGEIAARTSAPERIAVLAGNVAWPKLQPIEARLAELVGTTGGSYIGQHGVGMMEITRGEAERLPKEDLLRCRDYICPRLSLAEFKAWCGTYGSIFFSVPVWLEHCRRFDLVVGARLHGVVLALQAGVPALCIAHDARVLELCRTMGIPHVLPAQLSRRFSLKDLARCASFDADEFDANRRALCRKYVDFLRGNGLTVVQWLEELAAPSPARTQP